MIFVVLFKDHAVAKRTLSLLLVLLLFPISALAQERSAGEADDCRVVQALTVGEQQFRACEDGRIITEAGGEQEIRYAPGTIDALIASEGQIWVLTRQQIATPLSSLTLASRADAAPAPAAPATPQIRGEVLRSENGRVIINLGTEHNLSAGAHIEFFKEHPIELGEAQTTARRETIAVAPVRALSENRAEVLLGLSERVPQGASAQLTTQPTTARKFLPPRQGSLSRTSFTLRPFLALGTLGAGTLSDATIAYQFDAPLTLEAHFEPLAFGLAREANLLAITGTGIVSYDTTAFQIGIGLGATTVNSDLFHLPSTDEPRPEIATALSQKVRLGALDGLHIQMINTFFLSSEAFRYGGTTAQAQIPAGSVGQSSWIVARGGGGYAGHAFGEIGLRVLARGNGDRGSLYFTPTLGAAQLRGIRRVQCVDDPFLPVPEGTICTETISYGGPMIGFQIEWRP